MVGFTKKAPLPKSARAICFLALLNFEKEQSKIDDLLFLWCKKTFPKEEEYRLAKEVAYGVCKRKLTLEFYSKQLTGKLKTREAILLHMALYQYLFLDRLPFYAICNETIELAKKYISLKTAAFFSFLLRKFKTTHFQTPDKKNLSIFYSYPQDFIDLLIQEYSKKTVLNILEALNQPAPVVVRKRDSNSLIKKIEQKILRNERWPVFILQETSKLPEIVKSNTYYIQNTTPVYLIEKLSSFVQTPEKILDLCVGPGGKLIASADLYPKAKLYANDVSSQKLKLLRENLLKYKLNAKVFSTPAEMFDIDETFDLILLDVPCSNSGVLHKRCEARWRISKSALEKASKLQIEMIENASKLLSKKGKIWYMTCSILKDENEKVIEKAKKEFSLQVLAQEKVLPSFGGWDGGFGCCLSKKNCSR